MLVAVCNRAPALTGADLPCLRCGIGSAIANVYMRGRLVVEPWSQPLSQSLSPSSLPHDEAAACTPRAPVSGTSEPQLASPSQQPRQQWSTSGVDPGTTAENDNEFRLEFSMRQRPRPATSATGPHGPFALAAAHAAARQRAEAAAANRATEAAEAQTATAALKIAVTAPARATSSPPPPPPSSSSSAASASATATLQQRENGSSQPTRHRAVSGAVCRKHTGIKRRRNLESWVRHISRRDR